MRDEGALDCGQSHDNGFLNGILACRVQCFRRQAHRRKRSLLLYLLSSHARSKDRACHARANRSRSISRRCYEAAEALECRPTRRIACLKDPPLISQSTTQPSSQTTRAIVQKPKQEDVSRPPARRMSSTVQPRPSSMYVSTPVHAPFPQFAPNAWPAVTTPVVAFSPYYVAPPTPVNHGYPPAQHYFYEPQPVFEDLL